MEDCPTHFYKYRSLAADSLEFTRRIVCESELWFSQPKSFNDPFDTCPTFSFDSTPDERAVLFARYYGRKHPNWSSRKCKEAARLLADNSVVDHNSQEAIQNIQEKHTELIRNKIGVLCLSTKPDNILMWSHYANDHRGICLIFDGYYEFFALAQKVEYPPLRRAINPFRDAPEIQMAASVLHKYQKWEYENEWRIVDINKGYGSCNYPEKSLIGLIFGASISPENEEIVRGWVIKHRPGLSLYRATPSKSTYELSIEKLE